MAAMVHSSKCDDFLTKARTAPGFLGELAQDGGKPHAMVAALEIAESGASIMSARPKAIGTKQIENDRVIVTEWRFAPGAETGWHRHGHDYIVVPLLDGKLAIEDGKQTHVAEMKA